VRLHDFRFVLSKRGTKLVYLDGNTFTPNDKKTEGKRDWKCSMYYKKNCKARVTTFTSTDEGKTTARLVSDHSHEKIYDSQKSVELLLNFR
jgi:hypothetical protein